MFCLTDGTGVLLTLQFRVRQKNIDVSGRIAYCVYSEMTRNFVTKFYTLIRPINFACINLIECYAVMILFSSIEMARIEVECSA